MVFHYLLILVLLFIFWFFNLFIFLSFPDIQFHQIRSSLEADPWRCYIYYLASFIRYYFRSPFDCGFRCVLKTWGLGGSEKPIKHFLFNQWLVRLLLVFLSFSFYIVCNFFYNCLLHFCVVCCIILTCSYLKVPKKKWFKDICSQNNNMSNKNCYMEINYQ